MQDNDNDLAELGKSLERLTSAIERRRMAAAVRLARSGRYAEAERAILAGGGSVRDDRGQAAALLARIYAQQGRYEKAAEQYQRILAVFPGDADAVRGAAATDIARARHGRPALGAAATLLFALLVLAIGGMAYWLVRGELRSVQARMAAMSSELSAALHEQGAMQQAMQQDLEARIAESVSDLVSAVDSVKADLSAIEAATSALGDEVGSEYSSLRSSLDEIDGFRPEVERALASLAADLGRLQADLASVEGRFPGLAEQIDQARSDLAVLPGQGASIDTLTDRIRAVESMLVQMNAALSEAATGRNRRRR